MKTSTQFNADSQWVATYVRHGRRRRPFAAWKNEVWDVVKGLPLVRAAEVIKRVADDGFDAGELTRRGRDAAYAWADRIFDRVRPEVVE